MVFDERLYSVLVVSSSEKFDRSLAPLLAAAHCEPVVLAESVSAAKRKLLEMSFDFVIINAPLPDEQGTKLAVDLSSGKSTVCLILIKAEHYADIRARVTDYGVFTLSKPVSPSVVSSGLDFMAAARERLRCLEKRTVSTQEKMEEIRLVNRAKWLLIENLKMTEPDAHRYLEKQAMNRCITRCEVAKEIIHTYT